MTTSEKLEIFYDFLDEYTEFFDRMEQFEQQKLRTILSGGVDELDHVLAVSQANAKQLDNLERRRISLQQEAGFGSLSMGQLAEQAQAERAAKLKSQMNKLSRSLSNIRFYNSKSMEMAEFNLRMRTRTGTQPQPQSGGRSILEAKA